MNAPAKAPSAEPHAQVKRLGLLWRAPGLTLIALVRIYQYTLSPLFGRVCRFEPSCSEYMAQSIDKYGAFRGAWRGLKRIGRCHPFRPGGYDPP